MFLFLSDEGPMLKTLNNTISVLAVHQPFYISIYIHFDLPWATITEWSATEWVSGCQALRLRQDCLLKKKLLSEAIILVVIGPNFDSSFSKHDRFLFFLGGEPLMWGPGARSPCAPLLIRPWGSWTNNPVIACDISTCVYTRVYWFHFRTCERKTCIRDTINIRFLKILFPCWTYFGGINCYYYIYFQYLQRDQT